MNGINSPLIGRETNTGSQIGRSSKIGFLAEKMIGGLAKKKKLAATQPQGLSQQALGQSPLSKDLIGR